MLETIYSESTINAAAEIPRLGLAQVWQYGQFGAFELYGPIDGIFIGTTFNKTSFYWTLWNCATLLNCNFIDCQFLGSSFAGSSVEKCTFVNSIFALDNLGGQCDFRDSIFTECEFENCKFVRRNDKDEPMFKKTRFYGCKKTRCEGLDAF